MPAYLVVIVWACADARLRSAAAAAAAMMRMKSLPGCAVVIFRNGRRPLTCLSMNQRATRRETPGASAGRPKSEQRDGALGERQISRRLLPALGDAFVIDLLARSEERRVGKECRSRW